MTRLEMVSFDDFKQEKKTMRYNEISDGFKVVLDKGNFCFGPPLKDDDPT